MHNSNHQFTESPWVPGCSHVTRDVRCLRRRLGEDRRRAATTDVITVSVDDSVESVAATMHDDVGHVPVVDDQVVGTVTESDLREYLAGQVAPAE